MDEIAGVLFEMLASLFGPRRLRGGATAAGQAPKTIAGRLRELSLQVAPPQPAPPAAAARAAAPSLAAPPTGAPANAAGLLAARSTAARPASTEGRAVAALFADPQSLVAAFVVSEVLAKPVALRDR